MYLPLLVILILVTLLLCYAGYVFLVVDKRTDEALEDEDLFNALDNKNYDFELPEEADDYEALKEEDADPADKRKLPMALLERAKAGIPRIEQLEKDHPRMARLFQKGLLPFGLWEQLLEAEALMDTEVREVQEEAEKLHKGWGQGVFSQAYQMLRKEREEEQRDLQLKREAAELKLSFTALSGATVSMIADGRNITAQTQMALRRDFHSEEVPFKTNVEAELTIGTGESKRTVSCSCPDLELKKEEEKQWKQVGQDPNGLRLQVKFVRRDKGPKTVFCVADIRATAPGPAANATDDSKAEGATKAEAS